MLDASFYIEKLEVLRRFIINGVDGKSQSTLEEAYESHRVARELEEINKKECALKSDIIIVTDHAYERAKERLSMNRTSFLRLAEKAYQLGSGRNEAVGNLKKFIQMRFAIHMKANNIKLYGENVFFFSKNVLITVYEVPRNLRKAALKNQKSNQQQ